MPPLSARAWSPGHVTGFFAIRDSASDELARGSVGAGFSVSLGVICQVSASRAARPWTERRGVEARIGKRREEIARLKVTESVLRRFRSVLPDPRRRHALSIAFAHELPVEQGFGVSGAAALSLSLALADLYDLPQTFAHESAHIAEVESRTGLGDVAAEVQGGFEMRVRPGLPPKGRVLPLAIRGPVVLASLGPKLPTRKVLGDAGARRRVNASGARALRAFREEPTAEGFASISREFAERAGLAHPGVTRVAQALGDLAPAGQAMLGRALFALPKVEDIEPVLARLPSKAPRWLARISTGGCGLLTDES
jgi:pantoate kinase